MPFLTKRAPLNGELYVDDRWMIYIVSFPILVDWEEPGNETRPTNRIWVAVLLSKLQCVLFVLLGKI